MASASTFDCPVCGYGGLKEQPWHDGSGSDEICPCCSVHFGYDDATGGDPSQREQIHRELREAWMAGGCLWWSQSRHAPAGWDPAKQLADLDAHQ